MEDDSLALSGASDIYSSGSQNGFVSNAMRNEKYYSPENQINNTTKYNEMDFYRFQKGERKQPDYIVVFREDGKIPNMEEAKKAQNQWGKLPIVIIDKDKCLEGERQKVEEMITRYEAGEKSLAGEIYQKIRNNRVTKNTFCEDIDIEKLKKQEEFEIQKENLEKQDEENLEIQNKNDELEINEEDLKENYKLITPKERREEISKIRRINTRVQQIVNEKNER